MSRVIGRTRGFDVDGKPGKMSNIVTGVNDLPVQVGYTLALYGLTECSECRSWIWNTKAASAFHARRCAS